MNYLFFLAWFISSILYAQPPLLTIGTSASSPPLSMQSDKKNNFFGFEIDLMNEICNRIAIKCQYKAVIVSTISAELLAENIDLAIAAIIRPSNPLDGFIFSMPYLASGGKFITLKESTINRPSDIMGKTVGVRLGTLDGGRVFENLILQMYNNKIKIIEYLTTNALIMALTNKKIDVLFTTEVVVNYWYYNNMNFYKIIGSTIPVGEGYTIMTTTKYKNLMEEMNQALLKMMSDGTYLRIYNTYFSWAL